MWGVVDRFGRRIRLSDEGWKHILQGHPEMAGLQGEIQETLRNPDRVRRSSRSEGVIVYYGYHGHLLGGKHLAVVVRLAEWEGEVLTAYVTDALKTGEELWRRN